MTVILALGWAPAAVWEVVLGPFVSDIRLQEMQPQCLAQFTGAICQRIERCRKNWINCEIAHVHRQPDSLLPQVALADRILGRLFGAAQSRQQQRRQDRDDGDDDEQLDERKGWTPGRPIGDRV